MHLFSLGSWDWVWSVIHGLFLIICNLLYKLVGWLYQVFSEIAKVNLFDRETFDILTSRIYIVVGIAMLFIFAYNLVLMIINPDDKKGTGAMTKVIKETIISLVMVILLPAIFNYLYTFQNHILDSQIIGQIILGPVGTTESVPISQCSEYDYDCDCSKFNNYEKLSTHNGKNDVRKTLETLCNNYKGYSASMKGAYLIAPTIMSAFYKPTNFTFEQCVEYIQDKPSVIDNLSDDDKQICVNYFYDVVASKYGGDITEFVLDDYLKDHSTNSAGGYMEFNFIFATIAGVLAVWMFFCYTMEIGVRVAKLGVLQLISPIPVMMRIIPKQKEAIYDKWFKHLLNSYLDVFIRLTIIYFSLFAVSLAPNVLDTLFKGISSSGSGTFIKVLVLVFVILGILKFAQDAPGLIKEFFGSSGSFALKSPKKQLQENKLATGLIGGVAGGTAAMTSMWAKNWHNAKPENYESLSGKDKFKARASQVGSAIAGAGSGFARGVRAGSKSTSYKDFKYNTSGAIDRAIEAREHRDEVKQEGGRIAYTSTLMEKGWERFVSSDSYAALNARKNTVSNMIASYDKAFNMAETKLEEKSVEYTIGDHSYYEYQQMLKNAQDNFAKFDRDAYAREHGSDAAAKKYNELLRTSSAAQANLTKIKNALVDAILEKKGQAFTAEDFEGLEIQLDDISKGLNEDGKFDTKTITGASSNGASIAGLDKMVEEATSSLSKNSSSLSSETREKIKPDTSFRNARGALKGEKSELESRIVKVNELKKDTKGGNK